MILVMLVLILALGLAVLLGATVDSRDGADWRTPEPADRDPLGRAGR